MKPIVRSIRLSQTVVDKVQKLADEENRSFNNMVETLLMRWIEEKENQALVKK